MLAVPLQKPLAELFNKGLLLFMNAKESLEGSETLCSRSILQNT